MRVPPGIGLRWWWIAFVDPRAPVVERFLGAAVMPGRSFNHALEGARLFEAAPSGIAEAIGWPLDDDQMAQIADDDRGRLLTPDEAHRLGDPVVVSGGRSFPRVRN